MEVKTQEQYEQAQQFYSDVGLVFWLGANDLQNEGSWIWNSVEEVNVRFWAPSKPGEEDCMAMGENGFFDKSCTSTTLAYACQFEF